MTIFKNTIGLLAFLYLIACSESEVVPETQVSNFANLKVGNYWVYDWYEVEPNGVTNPYNKRDSMYISSDTLINGKTCFVRIGTLLSQTSSKSILFDSVKSIYTYPDRTVLFTIDESIEKTTSLGSETSALATGVYKIDLTPDFVTVPAGRFECINFKGEITSLNPDYQHGVRVNDNFYAEEVGLVSMRTQFYS